LFPRRHGEPISGQQSCLFADRLSCEDLRGNQIRLYMSTIADTLEAALRRRALKDTELERAQASTIRTRLLKIGVRVAVTARHIWLSLSRACPLQRLFAVARARLTDTPLTLIPKPTPPRQPSIHLSPIPNIDLQRDQCADVMMRNATSGLSK
jgi:hypothetical protein